MLGIFRKGKEPDARPAKPIEAPRLLEIAGAPPFPIAAHIDAVNGFPMLDWKAARAWVDAFPDAEGKAAAWSACEQGWLAHLRDGLGASYRLDETAGVAIVSSLEPKLAAKTLEFMELTLKRITRVLEGIAQVPEWGKDILIVFDDQDTYYRYASQFYPDKGEFAFSSGMYLNRDCTHFITTKDDLRTIEPVIAHEMTHACVAHLPLPLWLNEGLAVNTEHRLVGPGSPLHTAKEIYAMHRKFWGEGEIQEFWSGHSYDRTDDGNMLSYDLGRVLVEQISSDWPRFREFVLAAHFEDAGAASAQAHLGLDLGTAVAAMLEVKDSAACRPNPQLWKHLETKTD
jgi:hypothetical protein